MKINFFVLLFIAIFIPLNIVAIRYGYDSEDDSFEERTSKSRKVNYRHNYSEEYEEHYYYEDEEPEKPEPKAEEPKPEPTEKWTLGMDLKIYPYNRVALDFLKCRKKWQPKKGLDSIINPKFLEGLSRKNFICSCLYT
ncbi:unnamed protein product [Meloidogyne enterolobii]|uniref:Uncharacterized protein n=1 Tax=Meloidogyne enterolobii TaxID=390850 RepID=A0ACB0XU29_MELEN